MLLVYLVSAGLGGGLILASLLGHHDHDDLDSWFSLRSVTYALGFFGMTGTALHYLSDAALAVSLGISAGVGVAAGAMANVIIRALLAENRDGGGTTKVSAGGQGQVLVGFKAGEQGRISVSGAASHTELLCEGDGETFDEGDEVLITDVKRGIARVSKLKG